MKRHHSAQITTSKQLTSHLRLPLLRYTTTASHSFNRQHLVLHSTEHLPPGWAERYGAGIDWTWAFVLDPVEEGRTRFTFRTRVRLRPWWVAAGYWAAMVPADFVMARQMLRGVKGRAEATTAANLARLARPLAEAVTGPDPAPSSWR